MPIASSVERPEVLEPELQGHPVERHPGAWGFPVVVLLGLLVLTALRISGTSSGAFWTYLYGATPDPHLLAGVPRAVRSDEWLVVTPTLIGQALAGFPRVNPNLAGGLDMSMVYGVPYRDWSVLFRPESWSFAVLPLEPAYALRWWLPKALLALSCYAAVLAVLPRRHLLAAGVAVSLVAAPFVAWWSGSGTDGPLAYALAACALFAWLLRAEGPRQVVVRGLLLAYVVACFGLLLYPPYQIPCALVAVAFCLGWAYMHRTELPLRALLVRLGTAVGAGALGAAVLAAFLATRRDVVSTLSSTAYPGHRVVPAGGYTLGQLMSGFLDPFLDGSLTSLGAGALNPLGGNQSEASTFVLLGVLLVGVQLWLLLRSSGTPLRRNAVLVALLAALCVFLADLFSVAFDRPSRLFLLQLVPHQRLQIGLGLLSTLLLVVTVWEMQRQQARAPWPLAAATGIGSLLLLLEVGARLTPDGVPTPWNAPSIVLLASLVAGLAVLFARGHVELAVCGLAAFCLLAGGPVNPLYRGLLQVDETPVGAAVLRAEARRPGAWVSTAGLVSNAVLVSSGVPTYSAAFGYPVFSAWRELDPDGRYRPVYNRYAHVVFQLGLQGAPLQNPQADVVLADFAPCGQFAQQRVTHVLSEAVTDVACLRLAETVPMPGRTFYLYDVVPA